MKTILKRVLKTVSLLLAIVFILPILVVLTFVYIFRGITPMKVIDQYMDYLDEEIL